MVKKNWKDECKKLNDSMNILTKKQTKTFVTPAQIIQIVIENLNIYNFKELKAKKKGQKNTEGKKISMYLIHRYTFMTPKEMSVLFDISLKLCYEYPKHVSDQSSVDKNFYNKVANIEHIVKNKINELLKG